MVVMHMVWVECSPISKIPILSFTFSQRVIEDKVHPIAIFLSLSRFYTIWSSSVNIALFGIRLYVSLIFSIVGFRMETVSLFTLVLEGGSELYGVEQWP